MLALLITLALGAAPTLSGTLRIDQTESELQAVHTAAVDATLMNLPWALRGLARGRVSGVITNCTEYLIDLQPQQLTLTCDDEPQRVIDLPAQGITMTDRNGDPMTVTVTSTATELEVTFATGEGGITTRFRPDGEKVAVRKTMFSPRLESPVSWDVRYRSTP